LAEAGPASVHLLPVADGHVSDGSRVSEAAYLWRCCGLSLLRFILCLNNGKLIFLILDFGLVEPLWMLDK